MIMNFVSTLKALSLVSVNRDLLQWAPHVKVNHGVIICMHGHKCKSIKLLKKAMIVNMQKQQQYRSSR